MFIVKNLYGWGLKWVHGNWWLASKIYVGRSLSIFLCKTWQVHKKNKRNTKQDSKKENNNEYFLYLQYTLYKMRKWCNKHLKFCNLAYIQSLSEGRQYVIENDEQWVHMRILKIRWYTHYTHIRRKNLSHLLLRSNLL